MDINYMNPFIEASQTVLKSVGGIEAKLGKVYIKNSPYLSDTLVIIVGITGRICGQAIFSMNNSVAVAIASRMMGGMELSGLDDIAKSAIAELTNMIIGNTATILFNKGLGVEITPPSLLTGDNMEISNVKSKTVCIPLHLTDIGVIEIDISIVDQ